MCDNLYLCAVSNININQKMKMLQLTNKCFTVEQGVYINQL